MYTNTGVNCAGSTSNEASVSSKIKIIHNINITPGKSNILYSLLDHTKKMSQNRLENSERLITTDTEFEDAYSENSELSDTKPVSDKLEIFPKINNHEISTQLGILQRERSLCSLTRAQFLKQITVLKKDSSDFQHTVYNLTNKIINLDKLNQKIISDINSITSEIEIIESECDSDTSLESRNSASFQNLIKNSEPIEVSLSQLSDWENLFPETQQEILQKRHEILINELKGTQQERSKFSLIRAQSQNKIHVLEKKILLLQNQEVDCTTKIMQLDKGIESLKYLLEIC